MAGKDTDIIISVGAEADEQSAKKATKDLVKGVLSSLEGGYIPVPVELKTPIKGASKELKTAQEEVVAQWEKTFSKGFSSSKKNLDNLTNAYQKFKRLASSERKTTSKQYRGIFHMMDNQVQDYKAKRKDVKVTPSKEARTTQTKNVKIPTTGVAKRRNKNSGIGAIKSKLDYPTQSFDTDTTTQHYIRASDKQGSYRSKFNEQMYRSQKEERKNEKKSLVTGYLTPTMANELIEKLKSGKGSVPSTEQANKELAKLSKDEIKEYLNNALKGLIEGSDLLALLPESMQKVVAHTEKAGEGLYKAIIKISDAMASYFYRKGGNLGVAYDDVPMSEKSYYDDMEKAWKVVLEKLGKLQNIKGKNGMFPTEDDELLQLGGTHSKNKNKRKRRIR